MKRILLFVLTNVMVVAVLGIVASLLGVNRYLRSPAACPPSGTRRTPRARVTTL